MGFYDFLLFNISFEHMAEDVIDSIQERRKENVVMNFENNFLKVMKFFEVNLLIV